MIFSTAANNDEIYIKCLNCDVNSTIEASKFIMLSYGFSWITPFNNASIV